MLDEMLDAFAPALRIILCAMVNFMCHCIVLTNLSSIYEEKKDFFILRVTKKRMNFKMVYCFHS